MICEIYDIKAVIYTKYMLKNVHQIQKLFIHASMLETHKSLNTDATVACMKVPLSESNQFGIVSTDENQKIVRFEEKPNNESIGHKLAEDK